MVTFQQAIMIAIKSLKQNILVHSESASMSSYG